MSGGHSVAVVGSTVTLGQRCIHGVTGADLRAIGFSTEC
jgi:hypothetical protein